MKSTVPTYYSRGQGGLRSSPVAQFSTKNWKSWEIIPRGSTITSERKIARGDSSLSVLQNWSKMRLKQQTCFGWSDQIFLFSYMFRPSKSTKINEHRWESIESERSDFPRRGPREVEPPPSRGGGGGEPLEVSMCFLLFLRNHKNTNTNAPCKQKHMGERIFIIKYHKNHPFSMLNHEPSAKFRGGLDFRGPEGRKAQNGPKKTKYETRFPVVFLFEGGVGVPFFWPLINRR